MLTFMWTCGSSWWWCGDDDDDDDHDVDDDEDDDDENDPNETCKFRDEISSRNGQVFPT